MGELRHPESPPRIPAKKQSAKPPLQQRAAKAGGSFPTRQAAIEAAGELGIDAVVINRAIEVIGNKAAALRWMGTPVRALDYGTPISLLHTPKGRKVVRDVLDRLEYGVL